MHWTMSRHDGNEKSPTYNQEMNIVLIFAVLCSVMLVSLDPLHRLYLCEQIKLQTTLVL